MAVNTVVLLSHSHLPMFLEECKSQGVILNSDPLPFNAGFSFFQIPEQWIPIMESICTAHNAARDPHSFDPPWKVQ